MDAKFNGYSVCYMHTNQNQFIYFNLLNVNGHGQNANVMDSDNYCIQFMKIIIKYEIFILHCKSRKLVFCSQFSGVQV